MRRTDQINGFAAEGFGAVAEAFRENFERRGELGAAVCVHHRGRVVVDLWGGTRDRSTGAPWEADTIVPVFSTGKGLAAIAVAAAVSRGWLDFDDRVSDRWPEFARGGKQAVSLRQILTHSSGLVLYGRRIGRETLGDPQAMARVVEAMVPAWTPGENWGYHIATFGDLIAEVLRHADPLQRPFARLFAEEVAAPLAVDLHFGLPEGVPDVRLARIAPPTFRQVAAGVKRTPPRLWLKALKPGSLLKRAVREVRGFDMNDRGWLRVPFPSANAIGTARAIAAVYAEMAGGGDRLGISPRVMEAILAAPTPPPGGPFDRVMGVDTEWGLGFVRPGRVFTFAPSARAFGMPGLGGSFGFADPERGIGYAYVPNRLGMLPFDDPRELALRRAMDHSLARLGRPSPERRPAARTAGPGVGADLPE